jgi:hypothetical protein
LQEKVMEEAPFMCGMTPWRFSSAKTSSAANRVLMIGLVGGGLVACALGASIYDVGDWLDMW